MKVTKRSKNTLVDFFNEKVRQLPEGKLPAIRRLQGNSDANIVVVAPIPGEHEGRNDLCWCSPSASVFFSAAAQALELDNNRHFLVVPANFYVGSKKTDEGHALATSLITGLASAPQVKCFWVIGGFPFKTHFGMSKTPDFSALGHTPLYPAHSRFKPVFVFPDLSSLDFIPPEGRRLSRFEFFKERDKITLSESLPRQMERMRPFLHALGLARMP